MAFLPEWTWYNVLPVAFFLGVALPGFKGQSKAEEAPVVWSKFAIGRSHNWPVSARCGMLSKYIPAFLLTTWRVTVFKAGLGAMEIMMLAHFAKRICEVLFLHDFSGSPTEDGVSSVTIGGFYSLVAWSYCRDGAQADGFVFCLGVALFCVGMFGNFYHHVLLTHLRRPNFKGPSDTSGKYKIPIGGLFELVTCPHYLFEITMFWGASITAFSLLSMSLAVETAMRLAGHAMSTTRWYQGKFGKSWPEERKHMVPYIF